MSWELEYISRAIEEEIRRMPWWKKLGWIFVGIGERIIDKIRAIRSYVQVKP